MGKANRTRREALKHATLAGAAALPLLYPTFAGAQGSTDRLRLAVIGCGMRGKYLIANLPEDVTVTALCDCSLDQVETIRRPTGEFKEPLARFAAGDGARCSVYQDYRVMLDREQLDGVIISAPDHHHALPMMLACQRGIDVYVEKPLAVTIAEGRAMLDCARKHERVVQVGSQQRTMEVNRFACEFVRGGGIGEVKLVQVRNFPGPMRYDWLAREGWLEQAISEASAPPSMAWDLFCGPTPLRQYNRNLWIKDAYPLGFLTWRAWDLFRSYSGHLMTNWGGHSIDMVQYALGMDDTGPVRIELRKDDINKFVDDMWHDKTPPLGTLADDRRDKLRFCPISMWYANGTELRFDPTARTTIFHGTRGKLYLTRNDYRTDPVDLAPPPNPVEQNKWEGEGHVARPHLENWLSCIRTREQPNAPIEFGHRTATACHLGNIARELGHSLTWDPEREKFEEASANRLLSRPRRKGFELPS